jgi:exodeoxyribonuclease-3
MRVATWNINGLRARLDFLIHWLRARRPDIVGLQELKLSDDQFPRKAIEAEGYHAAVHGQKGWNSVAILGRVPVDVRQRGLPGQEESGARLLAAYVGGLSFTTIYVPNGKTVGHEDYPRKLAWLDALSAHLHRDLSADVPTVVCGDFNLAPTELDSWHEPLPPERRIHHTEEERARYVKLLQWGLVDLFRDKFPDLRAYSWWDYRGGAFHRNQGLRIDLLLGTRSVLTRLRSVEIDRDYRKKKDGLTASDHAPVIADLE